MHMYMYKHVYVYAYMFGRVHVCVCVCASICQYFKTQQINFQNIRKNLRHTIAMDTSSEKKREVDSPHHQKL